MRKNFSKSKYQTPMLDRKMYRRWVKEQGGTLSFGEWNEGWIAIRKAFFDTIISHPAGVDLPLFMGNMSIKILDNEFKCAKDFLKSSYRPHSGAPYAWQPFISTDTPKRAKIVWKKHKLFMGIPATMGLQASDTFKTVVSNAVRGRTGHYEKVGKYGAKKSKCEDKLPRKGLFDD